MPTDADDAIVVYSDYVCPFCYLGKASLESYLAQAEDPPEVEWRPFDLRGFVRGPDGRIDRSVDDGKDEAYYRRAKQNVERLRDEYGVEMTLDVPRETDSWDAQKLSVYIRREHGDDAFTTFHNAVFDAMWRDGRDISDHDLLVELAEDAGVSPDETREALQDDSLDEELKAQFAQVRRSGVHAVPTFVYQGRVAPGAVPPELLGRLVEGPGSSS